jgi:hypothetical protein
MNRFRKILRASLPATARAAGAGLLSYGLILWEPTGTQLLVMTASIALGYLSAPGLHWLFRRRQA